MVTNTFYGQVQYYLLVTLPKCKKVKVKNDATALLAIITFCREAAGDATEAPIWYSRMGTDQAVHISTIQCPVGRVKVDKEWGIVDVSFECARTMFIDEEDDEGDGGPEDDED
jgi:hypothetical protein